MAALVMTGDPNTNAQVVVLSLILPAPRILIAGAPDPYLLALHAALSKIAGDLGDIDRVALFAEARGVDVGVVSDHVADALQILRGVAGELLTGDHRAPLLAAADTRLVAALEALKPAPATPMSPMPGAPRSPDDIAAIARRRDAESRGRGMKVKGRELLGGGGVQ